MGVTEAKSSPNSPSVGRVRRSLPEFQGDCHSQSPLSANTRRSFRTSGRSSHSTSSEKSPFGTASARSSLRGSINRGSPSPARKLTTPQGPKLATANRQRQCRCSETHHHGHHGHVTPVVPRVPLERERACRRSHGSNVVEESKAPRRASSRASEARTSVCSRQSSMRDTSPTSSDLQGRRDSAQSRRDSEMSRRDSEMSRRDSEISRRNSEMSRRDSEMSRRDSEMSRRDSAMSRRDSAQSQRDSEYERRDSELGRRDSSPMSLSPPASLLSPRRGSVASSEAESSDGSPPSSVTSSADASSDKSAQNKGSVTTLVNWVPWLAEKRYYTTFRITAPQSPVMVTIPPSKKSSLTETHHFKVIHTSSTAQPSFTTSIGAPPGAIIARLSMA